MTKEEAMKEIGRLKYIIEGYENKDKDIRRNLTNLLKGYLSYSSFSADKHADMTWYEICFHIGELRADADIQCLIQGRNMLQDELDTMKNKPPQSPSL